MDTSTPHWELSVLSRAVAYPNLSGAAGNIGISQPQLSRLIARLEQHLGVELLDRSSRRKSGWLPAAYKVAELYSSASRSLEKGLRAAARETELRQLRVGTLEGLASVAMDICRPLFDAESAVEQVGLDVHDLHVLEELFAKGTLDLVLVSRVPGRKKPRHLRLLGYQTLEHVSRKGAHTLVLSPFEQATHHDTAGRELPAGDGGVGTAPARVLVSNSLAVRRLWIERFGGAGVLPSSLAKRAGSGERGLPVYLLGSDTLPAALWQRLSRAQTEF